MIVAFMMLVFVSNVIAQPKQEVLKIFWPKEYNWKIASNQQSATQQMVELIPGNQTLQNWSIIGSMLVLKNARRPLAAIPPVLLAAMQKRAKSAKLLVIEQSQTNGYNWILFKIQASGFKDSPKPESQLYYVMQGRSALFINFVAVKEAMLSPLFLEKWAVIFKQSKITLQ
ncbi:hypothetical protein ACFQZS_03790 [Mucilaginibacter calamicampi]|uniref:Uncharacterized protein n=1 Tax=Mucilaginibacter calamicampi TaxID=1302352 RepID=A0ABW2YTF4_9SPHI